MELTNSRLLEKFGTWRTEDTYNNEVQLIEHFPETEDKEPSTTQTLSLDKYGK